MMSGLFVCCAAALLLIVSVTAALAPDCHQGKFILLSACTFILLSYGVIFYLHVVAYIDVSIINFPGNFSLHASTYISGSLPFPSCLFNNNKCLLSNRSKRKLQTPFTTLSERNFSWKKFCHG